MKIAILDDENYILRMIRKIFPNYELAHFRVSRPFVNYVVSHRPDILFVDLRIVRIGNAQPDDYFSASPRLEGLEVIRYLRRKKKIEIPIFLLTRYAEMEIFQQGQLLNFYPVEVNQPNEAIRVIQNKMQTITTLEQIAEWFEDKGFVTHNRSLLEQLYRLNQFLNTDAIILITGETGVGKDTLAKAIHQLSDRADQPYIVTNIPALPSTLMYSELFGNTKNAFSGAQNNVGYIGKAGEGTLVLNEIGDLEFKSQVALLDLLENKVYYRLGDPTPRNFQGRIIALTNRNLSEMVEEGKFRADLFNRMKRIHVEIPPLRERREDIPAILHYLAPEIRLTPKAREFLFKEYDHPGNVRGLVNMVEQFRKTALSFPRVGLEDVLQVLNVSLNITHSPINNSYSFSPMENVDEFLEMTLDYLIQKNISFKEFNNKLFSKAVKRYGPIWHEDPWEQLGIKRSSFYRKLNELGIEVKNGGS